MFTLLILSLVIYVVGFLACLPIAYRFCVAGYDYGSQNLTYNGTGAFGFALVWPLFFCVCLIGYVIKTRKASTTN